MWLDVNGGQHLFIIGLSLFTLPLVDFLYLLWSPSTNIDIFIFVEIIIWRTHKKSFKNHVGLKYEWSLLDQYWLSCQFLPFEVFFSCLCDFLLRVTYINMLVTTQWPLKRAAHLTSLVWVYVLRRSESLMEPFALWTYLILKGISILHNSTMYRIKFN